MKISFALNIILLSAILFSCKKEVSELPPATQTGAKTFGCKVDGQFWVPAGFGIVPTASPLEARRSADGDLYINARNFSSSPTESEFEFFIKGVTTPGTYLLNTTVGYPSSSGSYGYYVHRKFTPDNEWITSAEYTGTVTITKIDTVNSIVSGEFAFTAINLYNTPQPLAITEGRFDVRW
jgi:Family of unknown function (DUF6252)